MSCPGYSYNKSTVENQSVKPLGERNWMFYIILSWNFQNTNWLFRYLFKEKGTVPDSLSSKPLKEMLQSVWHYWIALLYSKWLCNDVFKIIVNLLNRSVDCWDSQDIIHTCLLFLKYLFSVSLWRRSTNNRL